MMAEAIYSSHARGPRTATGSWLGGSRKGRHNRRGRRAHAGREGRWLQPTF